MSSGRGSVFKRAREVVVNTISKPPIHRVFLWQIAVTLLISGIFLLLNRVHSYSFFAGCLIQISGSLYFARLAFRQRGARQVRTMVQNMYRGAAGKILLSGAMFAAVFATVKPLNAALVFIGFLVMQLLYLVMAARYLNHKF